MEKTRWGIAGAGKIAHRFAEGLMHVKGAQPAAVASRSLEKARAFAAQYGFEKSCGSYEEMALDSSIDIVYVATPHTMHMRDVLMFLGAGRAVVCEKPLAVNAREAEAMIKKAREKNVFFMEGMWTRFFPAIKKSLEWIKQGRIGTPKMLHASFGYDREEKNAWRYNRSMAGGALLDVGIYPLALAFAVFGADPNKSSAFARVENGIDMCNAFTLAYEDGAIAVLSSAIALALDNRAVVSGSKGSVIIGEGDWWHPSRAALLVDGEEQEVFEEPFPTWGFQYEAEAVQRCMLQGLKEAPEMPLDETLKIAQMLDKLRADFGVAYEEDEL